MTIMTINSMFAISIISAFIPINLKRDGGFGNTYIGLAKSVFTFGSFIGTGFLLFIRKNYPNKFFYFFILFVKC
jgi:hypothetical protein